MTAIYGIKDFWAYDALNSYPLHGQLDTGKPTEGPRQVNIGERAATLPHDTDTLRHRQKVRYKMCKGTIVTMPPLKGVKTTQSSISVTSKIFWPKFSLHNLTQKFSDVRKFQGSQVSIKKIVLTKNWKGYNCTTKVHSVYAYYSTKC
ncbi:unnamed protein product [Clavelina lepadiformis]|uniref:Uncharacterized protein n=1 Tax=Clavelina lepadiformis TaxID=159417 RepID=A0ABP0F200_CLALP